MIYSPENMQQQLPALKHSVKPNGNYTIYLSLQPGSQLDIILLSKLDDSIWYGQYKNETLTESCANLFGDVDALYEFMSNNGADIEKVRISDIGSIMLMEQIPTKSKLIKVNGDLQTEKVMEPDALNHFYLRIIKMWQSNSFPSIIKSSLSMGINGKCAKNSNAIVRDFTFHKMNLTVDMENNPFLKYYSNKDNHLKIQELSTNRIKLFFNEVIPKDQCVYFTIRIVNTKVNTFAFGIIDRKEQRKDKSFYSLCYDYKNGDVKDSYYNREANKCEWRRLRHPVPIKGLVARMEVNIKEGRIGYFMDNVWMCEVIIPNYLMKCEVIPYISVKHKGDEFILNDE